MNKFANKIGLGSVQWGLDYGISNCDGLTPAAEVSKILCYAKSCEIATIDTAREYGDAEKVIGQNDLADFSLCTKVPSCRHLNNSSELEVHFKSSLDHSLEELNVNMIDSLLLHDCDDLLGPHRSLLVSLLQQSKDSGLVKRVGFSAYTSLQIRGALDFFTPDVVQVPFNVFDQRPLVDGTLQLLKNLDVEIHARSIFLQGLLLMDPQNLNEYFKPFMPLIHKWHKVCVKLELLPLDLALHFAVSQPLIDTVIIGISNLQQLKECIVSVRCDRSSIPLSCFSEFGNSSEELVNPSLWSFNP